MKTANFSKAAHDSLNVTSVRLSFWLFEQKDSTELSPDNLLLQIKEKMKMILLFEFCRLCPRKNYLLICLLTYLLTYLHWPCSLKCNFTFHISQKAKKGYDFGKCQNYGTVALLQKWKTTKDWKEISDVLKLKLFQMRIMEE